MIGIIGDAHFKENLAYADYVKDRREGERRAVLDKIVEAFSDCETVIFMGDNFDTKTNPSSVVRAFTEFVERFNGKNVFILAGNHEKTADGRSAVDYLKEIKNPKWKIITNKVEKVGEFVFCPYFSKQELGVETHEEATAKVMEMLFAPTLMSDAPAKFLFCHYAISDSLTTTGQNTNLFPEVVLPKTKLEEWYLKVIGGHIHKPQENGKTLVTGSVFTNEVGDDEKFVFKMDNHGKVEWEKLPVRPIRKVENPTKEKLEFFLEDNSGTIIKAVFNDRAKAPDEEIKEVLKRFDAYVLLEQYPNERKKLDIENGAMLEFNIETLIKAYAKQKSLDETKLINAWKELSA